MEEKAQIENNSYLSPSAENRSDGNAVVDDEISLKELILKMREWWKYLLSKWVVILIAGTIGGLVGLAYAFYKQPIYSAATTFVLEDGGGGGSLGQYAGLASMVGVDIGGSDNGGIFSGDNIIQLYKSRSMLQKTLLSKVEIEGKEQLLIDRYIEFNGLKEKWNIQNVYFVDKQGTSFNRLQDSILGEVIKDINEDNLFVGKPDKKLSIIRVEVNSQDEDFSKAFNDRIVSTVNEFFIQTRTKKSLANVAILQYQADSVKAVMGGAIYSSASTIDATPNLNPTRQVLRAPIQRAQFNAEANKAILTELVKNLELSKINLRKETPLIQVIDQPVFPLEEQKVGILKGVALGFFLLSFLTALFLFLRYIIYRLMQDN